LNVGLPMDGATYHCNKVNLNDAIKLRDVENPLLGAKYFATSLLCQRSIAYSQFCAKSSQIWQRVID